MTTQAQRTYEVITYGCQMNVHDSERISGLLDEAGYAPDVIAGTSIGAVVGGCFAAGKLAELTEFARSLTKRRVVDYGRRCSCACRLP